MTEQTFRIIEIVLALVGTVLILLQNRTESGSSFVGGGGESYKIRRGFEKVLFYGTIGVIVALAVVIYFDITG